MGSARATHEERIINVITYRKERVLWIEICNKNCPVDRAWGKYSLLNEALGI